MMRAGLDPNQARQSHVIGLIHRNSDPLTRPRSPIGQWSIHPQILVLDFNPRSRENPLGLN